jgi:hypothetical protein
MMIDEERRAHLVLLEEQLVPDAPGDQTLEELPVELRVAADRSVHAKRLPAGLGEVDRCLLKPEGLAESRRDHVHDRVQLQAGLQLIGQSDKAAQQLDLAALGLAVLHSERHPAPSPTAPSSRPARDARAKTRL